MRGLTPSASSGQAVQEGRASRERQITHKGCERIAQASEPARGNQGRTVDPAGLVVVYTVLYIQMRFLWDEAKNRGNRKKHGISFDTAVEVFLDPLHLTREDRVSGGEQRWQTIGMVNGLLLVLVAYAVVDDREEILRIISARRVTRQERIEYEEASEI